MQFTVMQISRETIDEFRIDRDGTMYFGLRQLANVMGLTLKATYTWWREQLRWGRRIRSGEVMLQASDFIAALLLLRLRQRGMNDDYLVQLGQRLRDSPVIETNPLFWFAPDGVAELMGYKEFTNRIRRGETAFVFDMEEIAHQLHGIVVNAIRERGLNVPMPMEPPATNLYTPFCDQRTSVGS